MGRTAYTTVAGPVVATVEDRRSVFECWLRRVDSEEQARAVVEQARATHWDARHHCSAFVLGPDAAVQRSSDDGEPSGTAGTPMLEVLTHRGLSDVVAVVTRWFGGTLLGTGGLVRAYSGAVSAAVDVAVPLERRLMRLATLEVGHADAGRVEHALRGAGVAVRDTAYGSGVTFTLATPEGRLADLATLVARVTGGSAAPVPGGTEWVDQPHP